MAFDGPWYISVRAVQDYLALMRRPVVSEGVEFARAERELIALAAETANSARRPVPTESGALRYRGPRPLRLIFLVMPSVVEERAPQLVRVLPARVSAHT